MDMILHKNGRFHIGKFSFSVPDNVYLNMLSEAQSENSMEFVEFNQQFTIKVMGEISEESAFTELEKCLEVFIPLSNIEPICINGLAGYYVLYCSESEGYCEYQFELPTDESGINRISLLITASNSFNLTPIMKHAVIQELLDSFK